MRITIRRYLSIAILSLAACTLPIDAGIAQTIDVPIDVQVPLFGKILACNRNLAPRGGHRLVMGVVYQSTFMESSTVKNDLLAAIADNKITQVNGMPITVKAIDLAVTDDLAGTLKAENVAIAYIAPLRAVALSDIVETAHAQKILTLTGVSGYVDRGISIGIGILNLRPEILINLRSVKAEGADFNSHFLKLARVVK